MGANKLLVLLGYSLKEVNILFLVINNTNHMLGTLEFVELQSTGLHSISLEHILDGLLLLLL